MGGHLKADELQILGVGVHGHRPQIGSTRQAGVRFDLSGESPDQLTPFWMAKLPYFSRGPMKTAHRPGPILIALSCARAILRVLQWVAWGGFCRVVMFTTRRRDLEPCHSPKFKAACRT